MKMPNFRLVDTQAFFGALLGGAAIATTVALAAVVFRNMDREMMIIWFDPGSKGFQRFRQPLVLGLSAITILIGAVAGALGFNSLGEKRNNRQRMSFLALVMGGFSVTAAAVLLFTWMRLSLAVIK